MSMIHEITASVPRNKRSQRKGRGDSSGRGKTCGRGTKGAGAHGGDPHWVPGHEGGQTPIFKRIPKRGFSNENFERRFHIVNVADLERFDDGATIDADALREAGLVPDDRWPVKILGHGKLTKRLTVVAGKYSRTAFDQIQQAGGAAQNLAGGPFEFPKPKKKFVKREGGAGKSGGGKGKKGAKGEEPAPAEAAAPEEPKA